MQRTQIYLSNAIEAVLSSQSKKTGLSKSQLIRDALEKAYLGKQEQRETVAALVASAGSWKRRETGREYVEKIRKGSLARRVAKR